MRRIVLTVIMILAALPWMDSHSARRSIPSLGTRAAVMPAALRDLVPASALLAIEVRDLDLRWTEIRAARAIARFQDSVLSCFGIKPEQVPMLAGEQAVLFWRPWKGPLSCCRSLSFSGRTCSRQKPS